MKKIKLSADLVRALLVNGYAEGVQVSSSVRVGNNYCISGLEDTFVRVCQQDSNGVVLRVIDLSKSNNQGRLRKACVKSRLDNGAFIGGATKFSIGDEVLVAEPYRNIFERLEVEKDGSSEKYRDELLKAYGVDSVALIDGWGNKKFVKGEFLKRKIRIISCYEKAVKDIPDEDFKRLGVEWFEYDKFNGSPFKAAFVGRKRWERNDVIRVYFYETIEGSVEVNKVWLANKALKDSMTMEEYDKMMGYGRK